MTHHESNPTKAEERKNEGQTSETRQKAQAAAEQATQKARETASDVTEQARTQSRELASAAKDEARSMAESRKSQVTHELHNIAQAFRTSSKELETRNEEPVARYADSIADRLENASRYLSGHSVDDLLSDAENFARQQPEIFLGSAFGLGLLVSRFFKSSERQYAHSGMQGQGRYAQGEYQQDRYGYGQTQPRGTTGTGMTGTTGTGTTGTGMTGTTGAGTTGTTGAGAGSRTTGSGANQQRSDWQTRQREEDDTDTDLTTGQSTTRRNRGDRS